MGTKDSLKKRKKKNSPTKRLGLVEDDIKVNETSAKAGKEQVLEEKRKRKKEHNVGSEIADSSIMTSKKKKKVRSVENCDALPAFSNEVDKEIGVGLNEQKGRSKNTRKKQKDERSLKTGEELMEDEEANLHKVASSTDNGLKRKKGTSKKAKTEKKKGHTSSKEAKSQENEGVVVEDDVYLISSGDEDCSKGMKKWISEYHESRPGITILQQRIDEFITAHEEKLALERKEREARVAEEGWTVVTHHKGRKKTTDAETGITVGSVAQAVVEDKLAKKKSKQVGLDFYRFQKKEAHRNDIMTLQTKFKEDMQRLQQLRAARKFRPY